MSWQNELRRYQNEQENAGWRIKIIPFDNSTQPLVVFNGLAFLGAIGFCAGLLIFFIGHTLVGLKIAVGSWAFGLFGIYLKNRQQKSGWKIVIGICIDRELRKLTIADGGHGWYWRVLCEYEDAGEKYQVTPNVQWMNCLSEAGAQKFIKKRIAPDNSCRLQINRKNPRQAKLLFR